MYTPKAQLKEVEQMEACATNQSNLPMVAVIYAVNHFEVDELFARIGSWHDGNSSVSSAPLKKYKICEDKEGRSYFTAWGNRFYLDECIRTAAMGGGRGI